MSSLRGIPANFNAIGRTGRCRSLQELCISCAELMVALIYVNSEPNIAINV